MKCPYCGESEGVFLSTPDYGYGYGAEFAHYCGGSRRTWSDKSDEGARISRDSLGVSAANAARMRDKQ